MTGRSRAWPAAAALAAAVAVGMWARLDGGDHPSPPVASGPVRLVLVADPATPLPDVPALARRDCLRRPRTCANGAGGIVLAYRLSGLRPPPRAVATVETDESCQPDRYGVSHCLNRLRLPGGGAITVRHDHRMADSPCLAPGERLRVRALASSP